MKNRLSILAPKLGVSEEAVNLFGTDFSVQITKSIMCCLNPLIMHRVKLDTIVWREVQGGWPTFGCSGQKFYFDTRLVH